MDNETRQNKKLTKLQGHHGSFMGSQQLEMMMLLLLVAEFLLLLIAEFLLLSKEDDTRSWGNFLVYFQMSCQPEGLGIHIYRLLANQAYAKMLVQDAVLDAKMSSKMLSSNLRCCTKNRPCSHKDHVTSTAPQRPAHTWDLFHHSPPKSCASSCGKVEPSRS